MDLQSFFDLFFDGSQFMTRDCCGTWNEWIKYEYKLANSMIFVAYMLLPVCIIRFQNVIGAIARDFNFRTLFAAFIVTCGVGHLEGIIAFWWTQYHLFAQWHMLTAIVSWATVCQLVRAGIEHE